MAIKNLTLKKSLPYILLIAGIIGYACAFIIMYDKIQLADNPNFKPNCNLNPIISCGNVMQSKQATAFGFPNPFLGLGGFAVLGTVGLAMMAGATFKRWFWLLVNAGALFAVGFVHWLFFESVYRIQALCPYCVLVWIVSITSFWYITLYNIDNGNIKLPKKAAKPYAWIRRHHLDLLILWFLVIGALILKHFWYYYGRNF